MGPDETLTAEIRVLGNNGFYVPYKFIPTVDLGTKEVDEEIKKKYLGMFLDTHRSMSFKIDISNKYHMSRKRFKKLLMAKGLNRNDAEFICKSIKYRHGRISYRSIFIDTMLFQDHVVFFDVWIDIFNKAIFKKGVIN